MESSGYEIADAYNTLKSQLSGDTITLPANLDMGKYISNEYTVYPSPDYQTTWDMGSFKTSPLRDEFISAIDDTVLLELLMVVARNRDELTTDARKKVDAILENHEFLAKLVQASVDDSSR